MPQQRRASPRRRDRRSRSRSRSPRRRRRSHSRSRSRDRRRSRSPQRKRSPERKLRSPPRKRSPPKKRSPSPKRHAKSRSRSPKRRARYSSSPSERGYPVKRPADSSVKRQGYRSRSASPTAQKRLRDDKPFREESRDVHRSRRSPSPSAGYGGKMYSDQPSSSKEPLFPAGSSRRKPEIDFVTIVEKGPKREKLNKRFETLEQVAQGSFDFEENITIGIHRGPQHIQLHEDEDIEVNYEFNQKTFKMLFPKKDYSSAIFDREEIRAFHHDDILDEEAYVEKRTISIKPVEKPKSRKYSDEIDYKVTVGSERDGYGDRRMVHDSGSRSRPSRSSGYNDVPVTVRLDPKPDPRYEKIYKEQQRQADQSLIQEKIQRNPNDLRYNLMRRKSDGDRGDRSRDAPKKGMMDARSRIEARRESHGDGRRDRSAPERRTPPRIDDRKRRNTKTDLPDFKNRPDATRENRTKWGHCSVCNISLGSEAEAMEHIESVQHQSNEAAYGMAAKQGGVSAVPEADSTGSNRIRGRGSTKRRFAQVEDEDDGNDSEEHSRNAPKVSRLGTDKVWVIGTEDMLAVQDAATGRENLGLDLGLDVKNISIVWKCLAGLRMKDVPALLEEMATEHNEEPSCILLHVGRNDLEPLSRSDFLGIGKHMINSIMKEFRNTKLVWSELLPNARGMNPTRVAMDDALAVTVLEAGGCYMHYPGLEIVDRRVFTETEKGNMNLTTEGCLKIMHVMKGGIVSIVRRNISIVPILQGVPNSVSMFVKKNLGGRFFVRKRRKKFPFARR